MRNRERESGKNQDQQEQERTPVSFIPEDLADVCARFADICDYFSRQHMDLPPNVLEAIGRVSKLPIPERIARMDELNRELIEYLHTVDQDSGIRH
jgi:hypothetical protein